MTKLKMLKQIHGVSSKEKNKINIYKGQYRSGSNIDKLREKRF